MPFAARVNDLHTCPMATPVAPHVGGPILPPGCLTILIGGIPAAKMGGHCFCVGPPDVLVNGSTTVQFEGLPAIRMGDTTAHGGTVILGDFRVMIGG